MSDLFSKVGIDLGVVVLLLIVLIIVGGKMSFALAMLDKENTGFILNAIHSRDNCFLYLKEIVKGESYIMLSAEEIDALRQAITMNSIDLM